MLSSRNIGIAQILLSGASFGVVGIFGKRAYALGLTPGELLTLRFLIASSTLAIGFAVLNPRALLLPIRSVLACFGLGAFGYALFSSCYFQALNGLSASLTVLLLYLYPLLVVIGGRLFFRERLNSKAIVAFPLSMLGLALLLSSGIAVFHASAIVFGILSAVFYASYILASSRILKNVDPLPAAFYVQFSAAVVLSLIYIRDPSHMYHLFQSAWLPVLGIAWISTVVAITLFLCGLKRLTNWEASLLSTAEPFTAIVAASIVLNETMTRWQLLGAAMVLAALVLLSLPQSKYQDKIAILKRFPLLPGGG